MELATKELKLDSTGRKLEYMLECNDLYNTRKLDILYYDPNIEQEENDCLSISVSAEEAEEIRKIMLCT